MSKNQQESSFGNSQNVLLPIITCSQNVFNGIKSCSLETFKSQVMVGLCINCDRNDYCIWQENKKVSCEHYQ